jgi:Flp pilus assembly protein TadD
VRESHQTGGGSQCLDRTEAALAAHQEALSLRPDDPQAAVNVGKALGILGRPREALDYLERAERNIGRHVAILPEILCN